MDAFDDRSKPSRLARARRAVFTRRRRRSCTLRVLSRISIRPNSTSGRSMRLAAGVQPHPAHAATRSARSFRGKSGLSPRLWISSAPDVTMPTRAQMRMIRRHHRFRHCPRWRSDRPKCSTHGPEGSSCARHAEFRTRTRNNSQYERRARLHTTPRITRPAAGSAAPLGSTLATGLACYQSRA